MLNGERIISKPLRWAMVGGGRLSQVGYKHRIGALRDNTAFQLTAGALISCPSAEVKNSGFSQMTCTPASSAALQIS